MHAITDDGEPGRSPAYLNGLEDMAPIDRTRSTDEVYRIEHHVAEPVKAAIVAPEDDPFDV